MSDDQTVTTGAKFSATPITSFSVKNAAAVPKGFFITSFWSGTNSKVPFIFDTDGDVVWWYTAALGRIVGRHLSRAHVGRQPEHLAGERSVVGAHHCGA